MLKKIMDEVRGISHTLNDVSQEITGQEHAGHEVSKSLVEMTKLSDKNANSVQQFSHSLNESSETSNQLSELADQLMNKVELFKVN